ncbi:MAG: sensor histidine kinase, partial [Gemmatimonadota bacterium]
ISYARVESGTELLEPRDVDIETVLETALEAVRVEADQKGVALRTVIRTDAPFCTDPRMLRQIVLNLVSNGVKYTREGHVTVRASRRGDTLMLEVEDTGVGIDEATRERIFDPFWQAEAPNLRTYGGLGIGLSLTRRLVETLGGELELESAYGRGATFTVRLPSLRS